MDIPSWFGTRECFQALLSLVGLPGGILLVVRGSQNWQRANAIPPHELYGSSEGRSLREKGFARVAIGVALVAFGIWAIIRLVPNF